MSTFSTGAVFELVDRFSLPLDKLLGGLGKVDEITKSVRTQVAGIGTAFTRAAETAERANTGIIASLTTMKDDAAKQFDAIKTGGALAFGGLKDSAIGASDAVLGTMGGLQKGVLGEFDAIKAASASMFVGMDTAASAAADSAVSAMARVEASIVSTSGRIEAIAAKAEASSLVANSGTRLPGSGGFGRLARTAEDHGGKALHFGRFGTEIPGGHVSMGGTPALAAAAAGVYGIWEAMQAQDDSVRLALTSQIKPEDIATTAPQLQRLLQSGASETGESIEAITDAYQRAIRGMQGVDPAQRLGIIQSLLPTARAESKLKGSEIGETLQSFIELGHMVGDYNPDHLRSMASKFSIASLSTNSTLPQFGNTLTYSLPELSKGLGMDADTVIGLTAAAQNAGINSTKSGTWIRSLFQQSFQQTGKGAEAHNDALKALGLTTADGSPAWEVFANGKKDWTASTLKLGEVVSQHIAGMDDATRLDTLKHAFGERGGAMAAMLSSPTFREQFAGVEKRISASGDLDLFNNYAENSTLVQANKAWRDLQNVLIDVGNKALPSVSSALHEIDDLLKVNNPLAKLSTDLRNWLKSDLPGILLPGPETGKAHEDFQKQRQDFLRHNSAFTTSDPPDESTSPLRQAIAGGFLDAFRQIQGGGIGGIGAGGAGSGFINASWSGGAGPLDLTGPGTGGGIGHFFSAKERADNIAHYAASIGIDPKYALAVARSEGFASFTGDRGTSFGDFQMHIGNNIPGLSLGGLGDLYRRVTGKNPADPHNELDLDRFALDQAKKNGWAPWHGAAHIGVTGRAGMDYRGPIPPAPSPRKVTPGVPASGPAIQAGNDQAPFIIHLDGKPIYKGMAKQMTAALRYPTSTGGPNHRTHYTSPGTPVTDTA